jgi:hypothetical protein
MDWILRWLIAFVFTQCVEMGFYVNAFRAPRPLRERLAIAFACSAITHPIVWFVIPEVAQALFEQLGVTWGSTTQYWAGVALAESFAVLAEAALLAAFGVPRALAWSLAANATSVVLGLYCYLLPIGAPFFG